jgi:hypothetical protein
MNDLNTSSNKLNVLNKARNNLKIYGFTCPIMIKAGTYKVIAKPSKYASRKAVG